jgi:hypothetical protein
MTDPGFVDIDWQPMIAAKLPGAYCYDARELGFGRRIEWPIWEDWDVSVEELGPNRPLFCHALNTRTDEDEMDWPQSIDDAVEWLQRYRPRP